MDELISPTYGISIVVEVLSPTYEIITAIMSYGWINKSSVWDSNSCSGQLLSHTDELLNHPCEIAWCWKKYGVALLRRRGLLTCSPAHLFIWPVNPYLQESGNLYLQHNKTKQNKKHNNVDQQKMRYSNRISNIHTAGLSENVSDFL